MIPVHQKIIHKGYGDCMRATIASLLELPLEAVPHFLMFSEGMWMRNMTMFWKANGYKYNGSGYPARPAGKRVWFSNGRKYSNNARPQTPLRLEDSFNGYFYASVPSLNFNNVGHALVMDMNGYCAHDPSPLGLYQDAQILKSGRVQDWYLVEQLESGWENCI